MNNIFLAKVLNSDDRDVVRYIEFKGFECGHYFSGLHTYGACFYGFEAELREMVENDFDSIETILTKEEFLKLFELNDELKDLGYGIEEGSDKYNKGLEIIKEYQDTIEKKLLSKENEELFEKVIADEKEFIKNEYSLIDDEIEDIYSSRDLDFQDRAIISCVFDDFDDMVENEKWNLGYQDIKYFNDEEFGNDLLDSDYYKELDSGKIVYYSC